MKKLILLFIITLTAALPLFAEEAPSIDPHSVPVQAHLITEDESIQPGRPFWVAVRMNIEEGWHSYWKNPGDAGMATMLDWTLPEGFTAGPIEWPYPQRFDSTSMIGFGYEEEVWFLTKIIPPKTLEKNTTVDIGVNIRWLVCSDTTCLPGLTASEAKLPVETTVPKPRQAFILDFFNARAQLPKKQWSMQSHRHGGLIELHLDAPASGEAFTDVDFFPAHKKMIDHKVQAILSHDPEKPGSYRVVLRDSEGSQSSQLQGVVVLRAGEEENPSSEEALEVQVPIRGSQEDELAMADVKPVVVDEEGNPEPAYVQQSEFDGGIGVALILAFVGGMILNLMPCVLPVISFKVLSFVNMAGQSRSLTLKHGLSFGAGVIMSFWTLAGVMLLLQAYGHSVGWGFQLQEPIFVAVLAALLLIFGLSMFGVFELGTSITALASDAQGSGKSGLVGSFFSGVLATAVATPCTGPFLGTAIGFAVTLPPIWALSIFTSLGLGMASPYLLLAAFPKLLRFMPRAGNWMITFKEIMGFLMLLTVLWLVWVFGAQTNTLGITLLLAAFLCLSFGCWIYGKWGTPVKSKTTRLISMGLLLACFAFSGYVILQSTSPWVLAFSPAQESKETALWQPFSEEKIAELQKKGTPVFVDFTAKWCLICQTNHLVLSTPEVESKLNELGVVRMKADWTKNDKKITQALRKFGRNGVPLYVLYGANTKVSPQILPQVLTPEIVLQSLEKVDKQIADAKKI